MKNSLCLLARNLGAVALACAPGASQAQALPEGVRFGMSASELRAALPAAESVARPRRMAGGLVGSWRGAPVHVGGLELEPVFYFAAGRLQRVEFAADAQAQPDLGAQAFDQIVRWGRESFGPEMASADAGSQYAAWSQEAIDVYAQRMQGARGTVVRLVYAARERKDDSEL